MLEDLCVVIKISKNAKKQKNTFCFFQKNQKYKSLILLKNKGFEVIRFVKKQKKMKIIFDLLYIFVNCRKSNKNNFLAFSLYINEKDKQGKKRVKIVVVKVKNTI